MAEFRSIQIRVLISSKRRPTPPTQSSEKWKWVENAAGLEAPSNRRGAPEPYRRYGTWSTTMPLSLGGWWLLKPNETNFAEFPSSTVSPSGTVPREYFLSPMFSFCLQESATLPGVTAMSPSDLSTPHFEADDTESAMGAGEAVNSPWKSVLDLNADPRWQLAQRIVASRSFAKSA